MPIGRFVSARHLFAAVLAAATGLGGAVVLSTSQDRGALVSDGAARTQQAVALIADNLDRAMLTVARDVSLGTENVLLQALDAPPEALAAFFARWQKIQPGYADVMLADRSGRVLATASGRFLGANVSSTSWFARALGGVVIGDAAENSRAGVQNARNLIVAAPVGAVSGHAASAVLAVQLTTDWADETIAATRRALPEIQRELAITVLNASGRPVHRSGPEIELTGSDSLGVTAPVGKPEIGGLNWLVSARRDGPALGGPIRATPLLALLAAMLAAGGLGWLLGGLLGRAAAGIGRIGAQDNPEAPVGRCVVRELHALAETAREAATRSQGRERLLNATRVALGRSRERLHAARVMAGATCWEVDLGAGQVFWTDGAQNTASRAVERVCELEAILAHIEDGDRDLLRAAMREALADRGSIREIAVRTMQGQEEISGRRLVLRVAALGPKVASRLHVVSREVAPVLAPPVEGGLAIPAEGRAPTERRQDSAMRAVVSGIVHDVNNALTTVMTALGTFQRSQDAASQSGQHLTGSALRAARRGASLTRCITSLARREAPPICDLDLAPMLDDVVEFMRNTALSDILVALSRDEDLPRLRCSEHAFELVLLNLACELKHGMPSGAVLSIVAERLTHDSEFPLLGQATVRIRLSSPHEAAAGQGQAAVRELMDDLGGRVDVEASADGTTVSLYFPAVEAPAARLGSRATPLGPSDILVVEADPLVRAAIADSLSDLGHTVTVATSGPQALEILAARRDFALVLCDYALPDPGGLHLASVISRTHPRIRIVLTGVRNQMPANAYTFQVLHKPFGAAELAASLDRSTVPEAQAA